MKKSTLSRVFSALLCLVLMISAVCLPVYADNGEKAAEKRGAITDEDMLHTKGKNLQQARRRSYSSRSEPRHMAHP